MVVRTSAEQQPRLLRVADSPLGSPAARLALNLLPAVVVIAVLLWPMLFDRGLLGIDWYSHHWYVRHQAEALRDGGLPSLFAHGPAMVFDPHFVYYAGNVYALTGLLSLLLGSSLAALDLMFVAAFASAYGGFYWLGRQAGAGRWASHAPGALFVSSGYYMTTTYGGGWLELMSVSAIPLLLASVWSVARAERLRLAPGLALAWSTFLVTGSHNVTLLWTATLLVLVGPLVLLLAPAVRRTLLDRQTLLRLAAVVVPAALVNAWYLLPVAIYQSKTAIGSDAAFGDQWIRGTMYMVKPDKLFTLGRSDFSAATPYFATALPLLAAAWAVVALVLSYKRHRAPLFRVGLALLAVAVALTVVLGWQGLLLALPSPWGLLQLSFRLESFVLVALLGALIAGLAVLPDRRWAWALLPIVAIALVQGHGQSTVDGNPKVGWTYLRSVIPYDSPKAVQGSADYVEAKVPLAQDPGAAPLRFDAEDPTAPVDAPPGQEVATNLVAAPTFVRVTGGEIVGRLPSGAAVVRVDDDATQVRLSARHPWPVTLGAMLSVLGLLGLVAAFVLRPGARAPTTPPPPAARAPRRRPR